MHRLKSISVSLSVILLATGFSAGAAVAQGNILITGDQSNSQEFSRDSFQPSISADGSHTAFASYAEEINIGADGTFSYIYVHDNTTGSFEQLSVPAPHGNFHSPYISSNGQFVAFRFSTNPYVDPNPERIYVYNRQDGTYELLPIDISDQTGGPIETYDKISISDDGNLVVFTANNDGLVQGDNNGAADVYMYNLADQNLIQISTDPNGGQSGQISRDGERIVFTEDYRDVWLHKPASGISQLQPLDINEFPDNYVLLDVAMSDFGNFFALQILDLNTPGNLTSYARYDRSINQTQLIFQGGPEMDTPVTFFSGVKVSGDGRFTIFSTVETEDVIFSDSNSNEFSVPMQEAQTYVFDAQTNNTRLITSTASSFGPQGVLRFSPDISGDGSTIVFTNLNSQYDGNNAMQIYTGATLTNSLPPVANAGQDRPASDPETQLDGSGSSDDLTSVENLKFDWSVLPLFSGQQYLADIDDPKAIAPKLFGPAAENIVRLTVQDETGLFSPADYLLVQRGNQMPSVYAGVDKTIFLGETVSLSASASDPDDDPLSYTWSILSRPVDSAATLNATTPSIVFNPDLSGIYYAEITVSDGQEMVSDLVRITVISPFVYATDQVTSAREVVASLSRTDFDGRRRQNEILGDLNNILSGLTSEDSVLVVSLIETLLPRIDGCSVSGSPDTKGKQKDWIRTCSAQTLIYDYLIAAKNAL